MSQQLIEHEFRHAHFFCGLGGGARGFNRGKARVGNLSAKFRCIGGIDVDPASIRDFQKLAGVPGTVLDLFSREQYIAFHGKEPPADWREATTSDIHAAFGHERPHIVFTSAPCKGFSGLLSETQSLTDKYQALNQLTLRGLWLMLEAYSGDLPELIIFENVPRIATRGRPLLDQIIGMLRHYGYVVAETTHDCGELGGLGQSRKRFLLVARHAAKVPPFLYEPPKRRLRGVGEILDRLPMPGDLSLGPMHRLPKLQWKTWVRLALVRAGSDWRSLNDHAVENGFLRDLGIMPEQQLRSAALGVIPWDEHSGAVIGESFPTNGRFAVADPRIESAREGSGILGVNGWQDHSGTVTANGRPAAGAFSVADPRIDGHHKSIQMGVGPWDQPAAVIKGDVSVGTGRYAVADPRIDKDGPRFSNAYRIVAWDETGRAVTRAHGALAAVADPRPAQHANYQQVKYRVTGMDEPAGAVIGASTTGNGAFAVADPRPAGLNAPGREGKHVDHYGVLEWEKPSGAVTGSAHPWDSGRASVADPRDGHQADDSTALPAPDDRLVAVIRAQDNTWHRPFTTLELAALQSLFDPEDRFELDGVSDSGWRERIGNAVPSAAAEAIAGVMGQTLLLALAGETFMLSSQPIWVQPMAIALAVDIPHREAVQ